MAGKMDQTGQLLLELGKDAFSFFLSFFFFFTMIYITPWQIDGETVETVRLYFFWAPKSLQMVTAAMKLKDAYSLEEKL